MWPFGPLWSSCPKKKRRNGYTLRKMKGHRSLKRIRNDGEKRRIDLCLNSGDKANKALFFFHLIEQDRGKKVFDRFILSSSSHRRQYSTFELSHLDLLDRMLLSLFVTLTYSCLIETDFYTSRYLAIFVLIPCTLVRCTSTLRLPLWMMLNDTLLKWPKGILTCRRIQSLTNFFQYYNGQIPS